MRMERLGLHRTPPSALAHVHMCFVHNGWPQWGNLTVADFAGMRRKVVVDGRRILQRGAMKAVEPIVLGE